MENIKFNKNNFDIKEFNLAIEGYCKTNNISQDDLLKAQLVNEEFLSNILFPNFEKDVEFSISKTEEGLSISYTYGGENYMGKINDTTILSLKILQNKTKKIDNIAKDNDTVITFVI